MLYEVNAGNTMVFDQCECASRWSGPRTWYTLDAPSSPCRDSKMMSPKEENDIELI